MTCQAQNVVEGNKDSPTRRPETPRWYGLLEARRRKGRDTVPWRRILVEELFGERDFRKKVPYGDSGRFES